MTTVKTFSLYLAKSTITALDDLLTQTARDLLKAGTAKKTHSPGFADENFVYVFPGQITTPKWVAQLGSIFQLPANLHAQSPSAVLAFRQNKNIFAVTFGHAHVYLNDKSTEADFGLKVAVNSVSDEKLRSIERSNIGVAIRDYAQAAGQRDLRSFGFDDALDLIRKVTGRAANADFADTVTGSRPLRFSKKVELSDLPMTATEAHLLFKSNVYKSTAFKIIDFLSPILDPAKEDQLNDALVTAIRAGTDEFEIAIPEIVSKGVTSFKFVRAGIAQYYPDLSLELYRTGLGKELPKLTADVLKHHGVAAYEADQDYPVETWSVHQSLVGSHAISGHRYALNEGLWYSIGTKIREAADKRFLELSVKKDSKLGPFKQIVQPHQKHKKSKVSYQTEESYNADTATSSGYLLMDRNLIQIDEVPGNGIEMCDLLDIQGRRFIHVKKSSRQSSVLSHLFKQGGNAARMFRQYEPFRAALVSRVKKLHGKKLSDELEAILEKTWTVEFRIADFPRKNGEHNIPFFSKLSLQEEARDIEAMGFKVKIGFIALSRPSK